MASEQTKTAAPGSPSLYRYSAVLKDTNGNGIPGVQLKLFDVEDRLLKATTTQGSDNSHNLLDQNTYNLNLLEYPVEDGRFFWHDMEAGVYIMRAYGEGFATFTGNRTSQNTE
tara:strand:- start:5341 stop:5679 length:339 start_codon:yes stop_codon:yes gene_type:complete